MSFEYNADLLENGLTYREYRKEIEDELAQPAPDERAEKLRNYIRKNTALIDEYDETYRVSNGLKAVLDKAPATHWLVIAEGWCGDAAFNIPMLVALEKALPDKVKLLFYFRDRNHNLIDAHLTDGGRLIPVVVMLNQDLKEVGKWGPRPAGLQQLMKEWKLQGMELKQLLANVHEWYDEDSTITLQNELTAIIKGYC